MSSASPAPPAVLESFAERLDVLFRELELAIQWQRPSILFVIYRSEYARMEATLTLTRQLEEVGQQVVSLSLVELSQSDLAVRLTSLPDPAQTVIFVQGAADLAEMDTSLYTGLDRQCDTLLDHEVRMVLWLTEGETICLARYAPDFWALRHRVVEFLDTPTPTQILRCALETAWQNGKDHPFSVNLTEHLALGDSLLADLSPEGSHGSKAQFLLTLGILHWRKGDLPQAIQFLEAALQNARQDHDSCLEARCHQALALLHAGRGHLDEAIETCKQALRLLPDQASLWNHLGVLYAHIGFYRDALEAFRKASEKSPQDTLIWNQLGEMALQCGFLEEALTAYRKAIELSPEFLTARIGLCRTLGRLGKLEEALEVCRQAVALDPAHPQAWLLLGDLLVRGQQYEEALSAYRRALALEPQDFQAWNEVGVLHFRRREFAQAEEAFRQAIALQPQCGWLYANLALVCSHLGRDEEAIPLYRQGIALLSEDTDKAILFTRLGDVCQRLQDEPTARTAYLHAREYGADLDWFGQDLRAVPHSLLHPDEDDILLVTTPHTVDLDLAQPSFAESTVEFACGAFSSQEEPMEETRTAAMGTTSIEEPLHLAYGRFALEENSFLEEEPLEMACGAFATEESIPEEEPMREMACGAFAAEEGASSLAGKGGDQVVEMSFEMACGAFAQEDRETPGASSHASEEMSAAEWNARGNVCLANGHYDEAIAAYLRAIQLAPGFVWPYVQNLALAYQRRAEHREQLASQVESTVEAELTAADSLAETPRVETREEAVLWEADRQEEALRYQPSAASLRLMEEAWQEDPIAHSQNVPAPSPLLEVTLPTATEESVEATLPGSDALAQDFIPSSAQEWNAVGNALLRVGAYERAIAAYARAIALSPQDGWPYSNLALAYCYQRRYAEAIPLYQKSLELLRSNREKAIVWNRLGDAYRRLNDHDRARAAYQQAAELDAHSSSLLRRARLLLLGNRRN